MRQGHAQVELHEDRPRREAALRRVGKEPRPHLDHPEAGALERLDHRQVAERQVVVEEVPVFPVREADVRLENEQPATRNEHPPDLGQDCDDLVLVGEVLEHVAREHDVHAVGFEPAEVARRGAAHADVRGGARPELLVDVDGPLPRAPDVVDELAEPRPEIEHGILGTDVALQEVLAEDLPDARLRAPCRLAKAPCVEPDGGHGTVPCRVPGHTSEGNGEASAPGGTWSGRRPGRATPSGPP